MSSVDPDVNPAFITPLTRLWREVSGLPEARAMVGKMGGSQVLGWEGDPCGVLPSVRCQQEGCF